MMRIHLCKDLSKLLLDNLMNSLLSGANSYLTHAATNPDIVLYFHRQTMSEFERANNDNELVRAALIDLRSTRYRTVPAGESDEVGFLRRNREMCLFFSKEPRDETYIINPETKTFIGGKVRELCRKGESTFRWTVDSTEQFFEFVQFIAGLKSDIDRVVVVEREPNFRDCRLLNLLLQLNPRSATCYYRKTKDFGRNCDKMRPFVSKGYEAIGVEYSFLIHERCIWIHDACFRIDNATDSINNCNYTWTVNFMFDSALMSKTEGKLKRPDQYIPTSIRRR